MLTRPRIKSSFAVNVLEPALLFLMSEHAEQVFQGEAFVALAPLLDGKRTMGEVVAQASARAPVESLFSALAQLEYKQCLAEGEGITDPRLGAFWEGLGVTPEAVAPALAAGVVLETFGVEADSLGRALEQAGIALRNDGALRLVLVGDYLAPELEEVNRRALREGQPFCLARLHGTIAWMGPVFRPGKTACWECLAQRLRTNRQVEHYLHSRQGRPILSAPRAYSAASVGAAAAWVATEAARTLTQGPGGALDGKILTLDLLNRTLEEHTVVRRPQCPACGTPPAGAPEEAKPLVLEPRPRGRGAGERAASANETYERLKHHVSPVSGVVTSLVAREKQEVHTHNYVAGHYYPVTTRDLSGLRINLIARSGGKGRTEGQARTSALCEAIERYSGIFWGDEARFRATRSALGSEAVAIQDLAQFSQRQYDERGAGPVPSDFHEVPPPLADDTEISWTPCWSLTHARRRYLPTAYCYYGFRDPGVFFTRCDSNGNAAGNTLEEAILYGFLELAERDSVALWWYNRVRRPEVDPSGAGLAYWDEMKRYYSQELDRELHALDLTSDLGIPTFGVISRRRARAVEDIIVGFAAHLDPSVALLRALEEANQYVPSVRQQAEDGSTVYRLYSEETVRWWKHATFENQPYLVPEGAPRMLRDMPSLASDDCRTDVERCVSAASKAGLEVLVLEQTRPDIGLPVVKVVVPGLRHFWRRLGPGRLYEVPVRLGWLASPLSEDDMNPISCFV